MKATLAGLQQSGHLRQVDARLGDWLARAFPGVAAEVALAAALAARAVADGHSALALDQSRAWLAGLGEGKLAALPEPAAWIAALQHASAVHVHAGTVLPAPVPLVLDAQGRIYLRRYFEYERQLAGTLIARATPTHDSPHPSPPPQAGVRDGAFELPVAVRAGSNTGGRMPTAGLSGERTTRETDNGDERAARVGGGVDVPPHASEGDEHAVRVGGGVDIPPHAAEGGESSAPAGRSNPVAPSPRSRGEVPAGRRGASLDPEQQRAIDIVLTHRFALLTGGPGTGKTHSVARMLAALAQDAGTSPLRIALAAPTGKAAARLGESLRAQLAKLDLSDAITARIPREAQTLHRLLGISPWRPQPRFDRAAPLPFDVVIVDEVSMVDLPLMAKLAAAVAGDARLILLGDPDQLSAVEAGNVLGALVDAARVAPLADCHAALTRSHRFGADSMLGAFAAAITRGDAKAALQVAQDAGTVMLVADPRHAALVAAAATGYAPILAAADPAAALHAARGFRVLTALRHGPAGCLALDAAINARLQRHAGVRGDDRHWRGRLILITANRPELGLYNGDTGVLWPDAGGMLQAWFEGHDGSARALPIAALPPHEGAFALTVHKAQGSEFERVALVTGPDSAVLTRELLYTGVTRARTDVALYSTPDALRAGIARRTLRMSGLADRLREAAAGT